MRHSLLLIILLVLASSSIGQMPSIIGQWRRSDLYQKEDSVNRNEQISGDLIISPELTFTIIGDESNPSSVVPGWHTTGPMKGKVKMGSNNQLNFFIEDVPIPIVFKIKRLSNNELYLQSNFKDSPVMKLRRL